ncbi:MAG: right-handed parallel beta-helix repeat-containing protein, partial [Candidatus Hodarchaeota archaeon]
ISNFNIFDYKGNYDGTIEDRKEPNLKHLKKSGYWILSFIHIDGNWSHTAEDYTWCNGNGSWGNPYTIENVIIDASGSPTGSGIFINNSKNDYFIIRNCMVFNAGSSGFDAGIKLENTNNGTLSNNNCSNNLQNGIFLFNYCINNTISGNTANNNEIGIYLSYECHDNIIAGNLIKDNQNYGLRIATNGGQNNLIYFNSFIGNIGWHANDSGMNNYWDNSIVGNYWDDWTSPDIVEPYGIVDLGRNIAGSASSVDHFPLTESPVHLGEAIHIDDFSVGNSWSETAKLNFWCTGSGTYSDPFIIDGLEIDAAGSGSCILIENSKTEYFIIRNCKVYNAGSGLAWDAGIKLVNTNNGILANNNCSNNGGSGILLDNNCDNNTISGNTANDNILYGIHVYNNYRT